MGEEYRKVEWDKEDVISFPGDQVRKVDLILRKLKESVKYNNWGQNFNQNFSSKLNLNSSILVSGSNSDRFSQWFEKGIDCKIMRAYDDKGWRKGKIRIKLNIEFELWEETEEPDSPLDNFREK